MLRVFFKRKNTEVWAFGILRGFVGGATKGRRGWRIAPIDHAGYKRGRIGGDRKEITVSARKNEMRIKAVLPAEVKGIVLSAGTGEKVLEGKRAHLSRSTKNDFGKGLKKRYGLIRQFYCEHQSELAGGWR